MENLTNSKITYDSRVAKSIKLLKIN